jgi:hypothetical protein
MKILGCITSRNDLDGVTLVLLGEDRMQYELTIPPKAIPGVQHHLTVAAIHLQRQQEDSDFRPGILYEVTGIQPIETADRRHGFVLQTSLDLEFAMVLDRQARQALRAYIDQLEADEPPVH